VAYISCFPVFIVQELVQRVADLSRDGAVAQAFAADQRAQLQRGAERERVLEAQCEGSSALQAIFGLSLV
jgi:hypothetical protein